MSARIKAKLYAWNNKEAEIILPKKQNELDQTLSECGIATDEDYTVISVKCGFDSIDRYLQGMRTIEELNFLAQLMDGLSQDDMDTFDAIVKENLNLHCKSLKTMKDLINLCYNIGKYNFEPGIWDLEDLGKQFVENDNHAMKMDEIIFDNVDLKAVGRAVQQKHGGVFTDEGYVSNFYEEFPEKYDGKVFPPNEFETDFTLKVTIARNGEEKGMELILPASANQINRTFRRIGATFIADSYSINEISAPKFENVEKALQGTHLLERLNDIAEKLEQIPEEYIEAFNMDVGLMEIEGVAGIERLIDSYKEGIALGKNAGQTFQANELLEQTVKGLIATAVQMVYVHGETDSIPYIQNLREQTSDIIEFWNLNERYVEQFDMEIGAIVDMPEQNGGQQMGGMG